MGLTTQTFDVLSRIAVGNGSLVYRALEKSTLRQVALKLLTKDQDLDHCFDVAALLEAVPHMRQITGSHVCQLLEAVDDEDGPVLVYEFANGISGNEFPHHRKLNAAQAVDVAAQLMSALRSGERQRVPHGDLKPSNVMLVDTAEGRPFLFVLDWGLAAFRLEIPKDSRPYLAPERLLGAPVSHQADLFAAGALLFYLLTGKVLAMGETNEELMAGWSRARPELLGELRPDLPPRFVQWMAYLLALDPQKRPALAIDAATALTPLHPPPAMVPPEAIRPRPLSASQRAQAAGLGSGIGAPPPSRVAAPPASGVAQAIGSGAHRAAATMPSPRMAGTNKPGVAASSGKKLSAAMLAITVGVATAIAGTGIWWFNREKSPSSASVAHPPAPPAPPPAANKSKRLDEKTTAAKTGASSKAKVTPAASKPPAPKAEAAKPAVAKPSPKPPPAAKPEAKATAENTAEPLVMESFAYAEDAALPGQKGGRGWAGAWTGRGARVGRESLKYPDHLSPGGSVVLPAGQETAEIRRAAGAASKFIPDSSGNEAHWYFAALVRHTDRSPAAGGEVRIYPAGESGGLNAAHLVIADSGPGVQVSMPGAEKAVTIANGNNPVLIVCRIDLTNPKDGKWDMEASVAVNPSVRETGFKSIRSPMTMKARAVAVPKEIGLLIRKEAGAATTTVDEVRYGAHWRDIVLVKPKSADKKPASGNPAAK